MDVSPQQRNRSGSGIGPLATLPVFFDLKGKPVLVAGGSRGAAWKAELLAACGAEVHVFAPIEEVSDALRQFLQMTGFVHHDCHWEAAYFKHFALAVAECEAHEARAFHDRAREAGVPVNVIDRPEYCQFKFGSIVNRSPLVIGISTDGAAPILAQAVRRRIEAVLPGALSAWARLAQDIRARVSEILEAPALRRAFWEGFVDRAFSGGRPSPGEAAGLISVASDVIRDNGVDSGTGTVTVIEAASDDPEWLTMKAVRALQAADVIVHGQGVSNAVLELGRREAVRANYRPRLLGDLVKEGKRVAYVHDGSPIARHEAKGDRHALTRQGIHVVEIPGIGRDDVSPIAEPAFHTAQAALALTRMQSGGRA